MSKMTRRQLIGNAGWAIGGATFAHFLSSGIPQTLSALTSASRAKTTGGLSKLVGLGINAPGSLPFLSHHTKRSVLSLLDLSSLESKIFFYNIADAHSLVDIVPLAAEHQAQGLRYGLISNNLSILLLDSGFQTKVRIDAPKGVDFGGHAVYLPEAHTLVATLRQSRHFEDKGKTLDQGRIAWIDCKTGSIKDITSSGGYEPHDIMRAESGSIFVANYGNDAARGLNDYSNMSPSLCEINSTSGDIIKVVPCPRFGAVSHISISDQGQIGAIPAQLFPLGPKGLSEAKTTVLDPDINITLAEQLEGKVAGSSPVLIYDLQVDKWRSILPSPNLQRRAQSIHYHRPSQSWWITFSFSDAVASCASDGDMRLYSSFDWGISTPRGVTSIGDRIFVSGQERGIAEVDARTGRLITRHDIHLFRSTHISAHG